MTLKIGKTNRIPAFLAMQVMQDAQRLEATGHDIMHLEVGQPSTPPPDAVNRALTMALGHTARWLFGGIWSSCFAPAYFCPLSRLVWHRTGLEPDRDHPGSSLALPFRFLRLLMRVIILRLRHRAIPPIAT